MSAVPPARKQAGDTEQGPIRSRGVDRYAFWCMQFFT
jgi:hypothetical protein